MENGGDSGALAIGLQAFRERVYRRGFIRPEHVAHAVKLFFYALLRDYGNKKLCKRIEGKT